MYSLTFWSKSAHFHHFSISTQNQSHWILVKIGQNTKCIALLFGQILPIFTTFQSPLKMSHIEKWWKLGRFWPSVSLTFWSKSAHFHHFSISTQNQSHWILVKIGQNTKCKPYFLVKICPFSPKFNVTQNQSHWILVKIGQNTKCIALLFGQNLPIFTTFQSPLKISHIEFWWKLVKIPSV